jgi:hypothetical protein
MTLKCPILDKYNISSTLSPTQITKEIFLLIYMSFRVWKTSTINMDRLEDFFNFLFKYVLIFLFFQTCPNVIDWNWLTGIKVEGILRQAADVDDVEHRIKEFGQG